jgi:transcriptional regulator
VAQIGARDGDRVDEGQRDGDDPARSRGDLIRGRGDLIRSRGDLIKGTLDMLILKTIALEPMHGWGICERIEQRSADVLRLNQGSLYPALHRLTRQGWIASSWETTENNRRARYYRLTAAGRRALEAEHRHWLRLSDAVNRVMQAS